jgi:hypothetical protein
MAVVAPIYRHCTGKAIFLRSFPGLGARRRNIVNYSRACGVFIVLAKRGLEKPVKVLRILARNFLDTAGRLIIQKSEDKRLF